ncbi:family 2 glycosyl transferase [Halogeometricum pallidum JCM 14848]|uniref:Family 2 glycosyl transferase n=1 Tax=Halogeometricum pallidum JCM 14848 TaxID=1227487 RepID=M0DA83_HALPD|nr:glycosyltransferase family 2 protein [Halogeometricum pallidum]ELZ31632.1 family 2 glycosyl transferase [Halogeometricum pallidum JCM 14848]
MYRDSSVAVVVPAYNEEGFVGDVVRSIPTYVDRIYAVDDRSTDGTWEELRECAERVNAEGDGERVVPIRHERNRGVGGAIKTGYERALRDEIDVTAVIAGDGQMDPSKLTQFLDPIVDGEADYTKGNRLWREDTWREMSRWRLFGNRLLTVLTKIASGYWGMVDPQNGYAAISLRALEELPIDDLYEEYGFLNDLLVHLNVQGLKIADVPHEALYGDEQSGIKYSTFVPRLSKLLLRDFLWRLKMKYFVYDFHPTGLCYALGAAGTGAGAGAALKALVDRDSESRFTNLLLSGVVSLLGWLFLVVAVVLDIDRNADLMASGEYGERRAEADIPDAAYAQTGDATSGAPERASDVEDAADEIPEGTDESPGSER